MLLPNLPLEKKIVTKPRFNSVIVLMVIDPRSYGCDIGSSGQEYG
jgi:hypothetical protein